MGEDTNLTGRPLAEAMLEGRSPPAPMHATLGIRLTGLGDGTSRFDALPTERHLNPMGGVHGGWFAGVLDSAMGFAVLSTLPQGQTFTTLEFKLNLLRPLAPGGPAIADGWLEHRGRRTAVTAARLTADGKVVATATGTCLILS